MEFKITSVPVPVEQELAPGVRKLAATPKLVWTYHAKGSPVFRSAREFDSVEEARADIAEAKRSAKAMRFAAVIEA